MNESKFPTQCVFIDKNGNSKPPDCTVPIPFNENSTRAYSKKFRVYVLRDFLFRNFSHFQPSPSSSSSTSSCTADITVLDVAGGRGDLSWILHNIDGINSIIADPRIPNHRRLLKSVHFLLNHPEEAKIRSVDGLPTHQPLAKLLPRLLANYGTMSMSEIRSTDDFLNGITSPKYMRIHVDNTLIEALRKVIANNKNDDDGDVRVAWDGYWEDEQRRIESNKIYYGGTAPTKTATEMANDEECNHIDNSRIALNFFISLKLIVGFHPDQATEASIDLALLLGIPFVVVPCCVFPSDFPDRTLDGKRVKTHSQFCDYLCRKHHKIRRETLPFVETDTAKNVVLYMLEQDICR